MTSGSFTAKKTFIGQYADSETSLSYLNARYYDSARGQFLSEDSVFLGMGGNVDKKIMMMTLLDPQSQNSYSYARDNPIRLKDTDGKFFTGFGDLLSLGVDCAFLGNDIRSGAGVGWLAADVGFLGFDALSALIPGVPAGAGTLAHAAAESAHIVDVGRAVETISVSKQSLTSLRRSAVRDAWKAERNAVLTNNREAISKRWTESELAELIERGKVSGYEGHHINSVNGSPLLARDPNNIKFLTRSEHLDAHGGSWQNKTLGDLIKR